MGVLQQFGVADILDITIISVLLYQVYQLLLGSRAWNVLRGIFALGGLWFISYSFGFTATKWIFESLAPFAFLAVIVVFQPELRAVLERVGRGRGKSGTSDDPAAEIMAAVRELASTRTGALIAIERQTPLKDISETGVYLGAPVSRALLHTIFASKGPLHDGGLIIKNGYITAAGTIFPLTKRTDGWSVLHGTRHRAGVGLSEMSDALVIIVSEERGQVSLANAGELHVNIPPAELVVALREAFE